MTVIIGVIMAIVVMFFEGKSMVTLDIFSGIIFAAPCAAFVMGAFWKKISPAVATVSVFAGVFAGVLAYFTLGFTGMNDVIGNICSLVVPIVVNVIGGLTGNYEFDYNKLKEYEPDHKVTLSLENA